VCVCLSLSSSLGVCVCISVCVCLCVCLCVCASLSVFLSLCLCVSFSFCLSIYLSLSCSVSLPLPLPARQCSIVINCCSTLLSARRLEPHDSPEHGTNERVERESGHPDDRECSHGGAEVCLGGRWEYNTLHIFETPLTSPDVI
jgi:hypothetical protein